MSLENKVAIVTGAAHGIGLAVARRYVKDGAKVVIADVDDEAGEAAVEDLMGLGEVMYIHCNVAERLDVRNMVAETLNAYGDIDILVNNAGIVRMGPAEAITVEGWDLEFAVNARGVLLGAQAARRAFGSRGGAIVNIASNAGKVGFPNMAAYNASKAAVINLTRSLAKEWAGEGINVNAVCPGSVATPMLREVADTLEREGKGDAATLFAGMVPAQLGRHITPLEIGRVVAFLLSDAADIIRGQAINLDGGETPY